MILNPLPKTNKGTALVIGLLLAIVASLGMTAMATLLSNRSNHTEYSELAIKRRIGWRNTRALTRYYFGRGPMVTGNGSGTTMEITGGWGKVEIPASSSHPLLSGQRTNLANQFSPGDGTGWVAAPGAIPGEDIIVTSKQRVPFSVPDPISGLYPELSTDYRVQLMSRSPALAGTLLVQHRPLSLPALNEIDIIGNIRVEGHSVIWDDTEISGPDTINFETESFDMPGQSSVAIRDTAPIPGQIAATNFPFYRRMTGPLPGALAVTDGYFNLITTSPASPNTLADRMGQLGGAGGAMVVNGAFSLSFGGVTGTLIPDDDIVGPDERLITINFALQTTASLILVQNGVHHLRLQGFPTAGSAADSLPPIFILSLSDDLETITLDNSNFRRFMFGTRSNNTIEIGSTEANASWRILLTNELSPLQFTTTGTLFIEGGIRTDARLEVLSGSALTLLREQQPEQLEFNDTREAWIEIYSVIP